MMFNDVLADIGLNNSYLCLFSKSEQLWLVQVVNMFFVTLNVYLVRHHCR